MTSDHERAVHEERQSLLEQIDAALDGPMILLSAGWIGLLVVEFVGDGLPPSLDVAVWVIWGILVLDVLLEFTVAPIKSHYLRTHWLSVALAALMPSGRRKIFALVPTLTVAGLLAFSVGGGSLIAATWAVLGVLVATGQTETVATT